MFLYRHTQLLSHIDAEEENKCRFSTWKSTIGNRINHANDNFKNPCCEQGLSTSRGSDIILLPRQIPTNKSQPLLLPKAAETLTSANVSTGNTLLLDNNTTRVVQLRHPPDERDRNESPLSVRRKSSSSPPPTPQQPVKIRRKRKVSQSKALEEARRMAVLEKREELLRRKSAIRCSFPAMSTTVKPAAVDDNNTKTTTRPRMGKRSDSCGSIYSISSSHSDYGNGGGGGTDQDPQSGGDCYLTGFESDRKPVPSISECQRIFSECSMESSLSSNLTGDPCNANYSSLYLPLLASTAPWDERASQKVTMVHPNPRYESHPLEPSSVSDPLLDSIDFFQHISAEESLNHGNGEYTWISSFFNNEGLWL